MGKGAYELALWLLEKEGIATNFFNFQFGYTVDTQNKPILVGWYVINEGTAKNPINVRWAYKGDIGGLAWVREI